MSSTQTYASTTLHGESNSMSHIHVLNNYMSNDHMLHNEYSTTSRDESNHHATCNTTDIHNEDSKHNTHNKDATCSERLVSEDAKISHIHDIQKTLKLSNHSRSLQLKTTKALKSDWGGGLNSFLHFFFVCSVCISKRN